MKQQSRDLLRPLPCLQLHTADKSGRPATVSMPLVYRLWSHLCVLALTFATPIRTFSRSERLLAGRLDAALRCRPLRAMIALSVALLERSGLACSILRAQRRFTLRTVMSYTTSPGWSPASPVD